MSRLRQSPKHLFEAFLVFDVEATGDGFSNPKLVYQYPEGGRRCSMGGQEVDIKAVGQFCLPYAPPPDDCESGDELPWAMLKEHTFTFSLTDEHSFLQFAVCHQAEIEGITRKRGKSRSQKDKDAAAAAAASSAKEAAAAPKPALTRQESSSSVISPLLGGGGGGGGATSTPPDDAAAGAAEAAPAKESHEAGDSHEQESHGGAKKAPPRPPPPKSKPLTKRVACIVSHYPWRDFFTGVVRDAVQMSPERRTRFLEKLSQKDSDFRFHQLSGKKVKVTLDKSTEGGSGDFRYEVPNDAKLPASLSPDTETMCQLLGPTVMVKAFCALLLERRVLVVSENLGTVTRCIYTLNALMYPMTWQHTFIPMMPYHVREVACAMMPYIVGMHSSLRGEVLELLEEDDEGFVVIDCDKQHVDSPFQDEKRIPRAWLRVLTTAASIKPTGTPGAASLDIAEGFCALFVEAFGHIDKFIVDGPEGCTLDHAGFLNEVGPKLQPFLIDLMETQHFRQFVDSRCERKLAGKTGDSARGDLFGQMVTRQASATDAAMHADREQRGRAGTFARLFAKKKTSRHKRSLSGDFRPSSVGGRRTEQMLQRARASTASTKPGAGQDAKTYQEYMSEVISDMEQTIRKLEAELAELTTKHGKVAMQYAELVSKNESVASEVAEYVPTSVSVDGIKMHGKLHLVDDLITEIHALRQSLVSITQQQIKINGSALSGVANLKAFWSLSQLDEDEGGDKNAEELTSDKVVSQLMWLLDEAKHVGESHDLALDRISICFADAKRLLQQVQKSLLADQLAGLDDGEGAGRAMSMRPMTRRYSASSNEPVVYHVLVSTGECRGVWPELSAVLIGSAGVTAEIPLSMSIKGGRLRLTSDEDGSDGSGDETPPGTTAATEEIFEVKSNYVGQLKAVELRATIPAVKSAHGDPIEFEWRLQMLQVSAGDGAAWTFPCTQLFSEAAGLSHTFTAFGTDTFRKTSMRKKSVKAAKRADSVAKSADCSADGDGDGDGAPGDPREAARRARERHKSISRVASLRPGGVQAESESPNKSGGMRKVADWLSDLPKPSDMRKRFRWNTLGGHRAETDKLLEDLHRTSEDLTRSPGAPGDSPDSLAVPDKPKRGSVVSDDSALLDLDASDSVALPQKIASVSPRQLSWDSPGSDDAAAAGDASLALPAKPPIAEERFHAVLKRGSATETYGCTISTGVDHRVYVFEVVDGKPASSCGLRDGDQIVSVDDEPVKGKEHTDVLKMFHGTTKVRLGVRRLNGAILRRSQLIPSFTGSSSGASPS